MADLALVFAQDNQPEEEYPDPAGAGLQEVRVVAGEAQPALQAPAARHSQRRPRGEGKCRQEGEHRETDRSVVLRAQATSTEVFNIFLSTEILIDNPRAYEGSLKEAQPEFLRRKAEKLQFILSEERDLGLEPSVTEQEIEECIKKADEVQRQLEDNDSRDEEYLIYKEDIKEQSIVFQAE